jgi:hypothetical protein
MPTENKPAPVINPSPRTRFQQDVLSVTKHRAMLEMPSFTAATDAAMLQYQAELAARCNDGNSAAAMGFKLLGAHEYLQTLKLLAESPRPAPAVPNDNLQRNK